LGAYVVGDRSSITVAMDWTSFDADGQTTIMLSLLCRHGRATPLVWLTVDTATLKDRRNAYEYQVLVRLAEMLPAAVRARIVADRGSGDHKLYRVLTEELKFDFVICFRGNIKVTAADGQARPAAEWVAAGGRARVLRGATVTAAGYPVAVVVCVRAKDMKEPWCLATSLANETARALINRMASAGASRVRFATPRICVSVWAELAKVPPAKQVEGQRRDGRNARQHPRSAGSPVAGQRLRGCAADLARHGRRSARL